MKLEFTIDTGILQEIDTWTNDLLPQKRQELIKKSMQSTLADILQNTPVETGRTKNAWQQAANSASSETGTGNAKSEGTSTTSHGEDITEATATNAVPYISYLEYGTSKMPPFATIRNALLNVRLSVASYFNL